MQDVLPTWREKFCHVGWTLYISYPVYLCYGIFVGEVNSDWNNLFDLSPRLFEEDADVKILMTIDVHE